MPDASSPSDWLSFMEYMGLTGDEVERLNQEALARAQGLDEAAMERLAYAGQEAQRRGVGLTQAGSYSDYIAAQQQARNAYRAMQEGSTNPYLRGVEDVTRRDERAAGPEAEKRMSLAESDWARRAQERQEALFASRAEAERRKQAAEEEAARRQEEFERAEEQASRAVGRSTEIGGYYNWRHMPYSQWRAAQSTGGTPTLSDISDYWGTRYPRDQGKKIR